MRLSNHFKADGDLRQPCMDRRFDCKMGWPLSIWAKFISQPRIIGLYILGYNFLLCFITIAQFSKQQTMLDHQRHRGGI
jgi:hypothetical protein